MKSDCQIANAAIDASSEGPESLECIVGHLGFRHAQGVALLDRAARLGLLKALGDGNYTIHPALPWFLRDLFSAYYERGPDQARTARQAFVEAVGELGSYYLAQYSVPQVRAHLAVPSQQCQRCSSVT